MTMLDLSWTSDRLRVDPLTGDLWWTMQKHRVGMIAGQVRRDGYRYVVFQRRRYLAHRIVWYLLYGEMPELIDHINGNPQDNRPENLRSASSVLNSQNRRRPTRGNKTGFLGVVKAGKKFRSSLGVGGKQCIYLGTFETAEAAHAAYLLAKRKHHEGCTI